MVKTDLNVSQSLVLITTLLQKLIFVLTIFNISPPKEKLPPTISEKCPPPLKIFSSRKPVLHSYQHTLIVLFLHTCYGLKIFTYLLLNFLYTCMNVSNRLTFIFTYFSFTSILEYAHILGCNYLLTDLECSDLIFSIDK